MLSGTHRRLMGLKVELTHTEETAMSSIGMVESPPEVLANGNVATNGSPLDLQTAALTARCIRMGKPLFYAGMLSVNDLICGESSTFHCTSTRLMFSYV